MFFLDDEEDTLSKVGRGYIGATVTYNHLHALDSVFVDAYTTCDAIEINNYDEWVQACLDYYPYPCAVGAADNSKDR